MFPIHVYEITTFKGTFKIYNGINLPFINTSNISTMLSNKSLTGFSVLLFCKQNQHKYNNHKKLK